MLEKTVEQLIRHYGEEPQIRIFFEESSELQKELCKHLRGKGERQHIVEEFADIIVALESIKQIFGIEPLELDKIIQFKCQRALERINQDG